jgi:acetyl-CoA synthetase
MMTKRMEPARYEDFVRRFELEVPAGYNFAKDFLDAKAERQPDATAMVHIGPDGTRVDYDFAYFAEQSSRLASSLARMGVGKGDRVMLVLYRRVEFWTSMLALHRLGAVAVPSPSLLTAKDIEFRVDHAGIKAVICEDSVTERVEAARGECSSLEVLVQAGDMRAPDGWQDYESLTESGDPAFEPDGNPGGKDPLLIFFTSGTTGMPKMVEHTHEYPLGHYVTGAFWHDLRPGDVHLTLADTGWGKAVWGKFYGQWMAGAAVFVWDFRGKFEPVELLALLAEHKVTSFCAPPTVYRFLVRQDLSAHDLSALRHCTTAGELLNEGVFHRWKELTGMPIYEGYGQTETALQIGTFPFMEPKPGSIGKPAPGWNVALLDEDGEICQPGEEGEICVSVSGRRPVGLFTGYMDSPEKTAEVMQGGWYHTGDKAWMDEDGYYWFLGRNDDLIKSSGYRVGPFEVESALITHPGVVEAAVTGVPDEVRGQAVKATVVLAEGYVESDELTKELQAHVKGVTAPYKYPRVIEYAAELPKTISGKIKRAEIRARDLSAHGA